MSNWISINEGTIRISVFLSIFGLMAIWELLAARRKLGELKGRRWTGNLGIVLVDTTVVRLLFPAGAVGIALAADEFKWGLFHHIDLPYWSEVLLSFILLDLAIYLQHMMFHAIPALWRLHMVHHADVDIDVTTGIRFHPIEIVLSMLIKILVIAILGAPVVAVVAFEVFLNASAMFNHANVRIPLGIERLLRWLVVTPDMHRVHHSVEAKEHSTNFGFNLSCWDRMFGTYLDQPAKGHEGMSIGLSDFREPRWRSFLRILQMPFVKQADDSEQTKTKQQE